MLASAVVCLDAVSRFSLRSSKGHLVRVAVYDIVHLSVAVHICRPAELGGIDYIIVVVDGRTCILEVDGQVSVVDAGTVE